VRHARRETVSPATARHQCWLATVLLPVAFSIAAAQVPGAVGPEGLLLWKEPRAVPELHMKDPDGSTVTLANFRGRLVLLNIWASWCVPCREEMPTLDALQAKLGGERFEVIALSIDKEGHDVVQSFYRDTGIRHLRRYVDPGATADTTVNAPGIPVTLLLDRQGRELGRRVGPADWVAPEMIDFLTEIISSSEESGK